MGPEICFVVEALVRPGSGLSVRRLVFNTSGVFGLGQRLAWARLPKHSSCCYIR